MSRCNLRSTTGAGPACPFASARRTGKLVMSTYRSEICARAQLLAGRENSLTGHNFAPGEKISLAESDSEPPKKNAHRGGGVRAGIPFLIVMMIGPLGQTVCWQRANASTRASRTSNTISSKRAARDRSSNSSRGARATVGARGAIRQRTAIGRHERRMRIIRGRTNYRSPRSKGRDPLTISRLVETIIRKGKGDEKGEQHAE
jgi:hypothetical protein